MELSSQIWQEGVIIEVDTGCSIRELLTRQLNIPKDYLENDISVIFLNGCPVDDIDQTFVGDGSVIALSAQLPGLVGAAMSKKGHISPIRSAISARFDENSPFFKKKGTIRLKLFNSLIEEIGKMLLNHIKGPNENNCQTFCDISKG